MAMNYRLGALGFAALPELAIGDARGVSGNYGFLDQILSLLWVRDNIAGFGGDAAQVTLMGHSSGGTSIFALLSAPPAKGLFRSALALSGSPNMTMSRLEKEAQDRARWLPRTVCGKLVGAGLASCLREADAEVLQAALPASYGLSGFDNSLPDAPGGRLRTSALAYVDGVTVAQPVHEALASGAAGSVSVLFQNEQCENTPNKHVSEDYLAERLAAFGSGEDVDALAKEYKAEALQFAAADERAAYAAAAFVADSAVTCGTVSLALAAAAGGARGAFVGTLVQGASHPVQDMAVLSTQMPFHGYELGLVTAWADAGGGTPWRSPMLCPFYPQDIDEAVVEDMWGHWLHFVTEGRPKASWADVRDTGGRYSHALLGGDGRGGLVNVQDWKLSACASAVRVGLGQSAWWIN